MITVAVDAGGADLGPAEVAAGAARAAASGIGVLLFGPAEQIGAVPDGVELIDAPVSIAKASDPAFAVRSTPEASIVKAARAVAEGHAQALVSGGSTGSALAAGLFNLRRDRGIYRPALALPVPIPGAKPVLLLDVGANVTCRPEHLVQFAHMGAAFAQAVLGIEAPRVALLSNGEEPAKGTPDLVAVHEQLARGTLANFVGNIEGTHLTDGVADVVVMDGFTGNITLKLIEGVSGRTLRAIRDVAMSSPRAKLGGWLLAPAVRRLRAEIDPEGPGGAYLLGLRQLGVVAHGRFTRRGFARAIEVAARGVQEDVIGRTRVALETAGALRSQSGEEDGPAGSGSSERTATVSGR
ncbi:MAG: phosphate acyltransferase PlsX [Solirubrobacterales bacterium]|nr:phosphate acyltransferase PlsX [Solirubrobacterales bacterium]MBV9471804.1 phosphate acyltransferase PlsX [Solirubrobacterales bacterium]MBV9837025.1 phosphate acyltransferase PlsX [Solirubrobacterales bacterium]